MHAFDRNRPPMTLIPLAVAIGVSLIAAVQSACHLKDQSSTTQTSTATNSYTIPSTKVLLATWNPQPFEVGESRASYDAGTKLTYRMAADLLSSDESQKFLDETYRLDRFGARRQLARTDETWPPDGHAFVRMCTLYPVKTTHFRWRRSDIGTWHKMDHIQGAEAFLDLGAPTDGKQIIPIEYELFSGNKLIWHGTMDVLFRGEGRLADRILLDHSSEFGEWLKSAVRPTLRVHNGRPELFLYAPPKVENSNQLYMAFEIELLHEGAVVGKSYAVFGQGGGPSCNPSPPVSMEWLTQPPIDREGGWFLKLTSVPELTSPVFEYHSVPTSEKRRVWSGSIEIPVPVKHVRRSIRASVDFDDEIARSPGDRVASDRVGGRLAAPVLPHHRTYSSYPAVSFNVVTWHTCRRGKPDRVS